MKTIETLQTETINFVDKLPGSLIMKSDVQTIVKGIFYEIKELNEQKESGVLVTPESLQQLKLAICANIMNLAPEIKAESVRKNVFSFIPDNSNIAELITKMFDNFIKDEPYQGFAQRIEFNDLKEVPTGTWASAMVESKITIGQIYNDGHLYICQNDHDGAIANNKLGFEYSWLLVNHESSLLMFWTDKPTVEQVEMAIKLESA